ncbi:uncharacterized protein LOC112171937 [Rosa chinensis]|uniref:uncharacterized protein LOC112171937 n=1 Tax=Rosa chinensis TaxID=74649 RepID=UPI000D094089|nr:uncharacterized protein LOC112171937 [Rosa chinensis]
MVFRDNKSVIYRPHAFLETEGCFLLDDETLSDERFEFLFGLRSACLPVRVDGQLILEPYYPNRFARQFGYDQSVPSNRLSFSVSKRKQCFVEDLARAQSILYRRNTTAQIYIPRSTREGECTWWYCKWWLKACIPYLGLSVSKTFKTFTQKSPEPDHRVFIVNKLAEVSADLRKEVQISSLPRPESQNSQTSLSKVGPNGDNRISSKHINHEKVATHKGTVSREVSLPQTGFGTQDAQKALKRKPDSLHPSNPSAAVRNVQQTESGFSSNTDPSRAEIVARTSKRQPVERQSNGRPQRAQTTIDQGVKKTVVPQKACISSKNPSTKCMPTVEDVGSFLSAIVDPGLALFTRNYLIGHVSDIFVKVSSSKTPEDLLAHHEEIQLALGMLHPVIESLKSGKDLFEKFTSTIRDMLAAAVDSSRTIALLKESTGVDVEFADNLISDYEACMKVKQDLDSRLADSSKKLQDLQATELDIKADEERVRKRRRKHDSQKASIENTIKLLKESIKEQEDQGRQLLKEKSDCVKDKLPEIEQAISSSKLEREKYQKSFDSFISLFPTA